MSKPRNRTMRPNPRTKPTTGDLGPRDPGPHGKTLETREWRASSIFRLDRSMPAFMQLPKVPRVTDVVTGKSPDAPTSARTGRRGGQR